MGTFAFCSQVIMQQVTVFSVLEISGLNVAMDSNEKKCVSLINDGFFPRCKVNHFFNSISKLWNLFSSSLIGVRFHSVTWREKTKSRLISFAYLQLHLRSTVPGLRGIDTESPIHLSPFVLSHSWWRLPLGLPYGPHTAQIFLYTIPAAWLCLSVSPASVCISHPAAMC